MTKQQHAVIEYAYSNACAAHRTDLQFEHLLNSVLDFKGELHLNIQSRAHQVLRSGAHLMFTHLIVTHDRDECASNIERSCRH